MKFGFTPLLFVCAIVVGIALSFAFAAFTSPHVVEQPTIVITPVPTPQPVYVQQTPQSTPIPVTKTVNLNDSEMTDMVINMVKLGVIVSAAAMILMVLTTAFRLGR
jgi:hypothetical protein